LSNGFLPTRATGATVFRVQRQQEDGIDAHVPAEAMPRYLRVAQHLQLAIRQGDFPVGSLLPTEVQLATRYGVSRQTVRQAIGQLRDRGMLSARKRIGTRVDAAEPNRHFRYGFQSVADLIDLAADTEMVVDGRDWVTARGRLTGELGCRAGHRWLKLSCRRLPPGDPRPLCCSDVYVDHRLASAVATQDVFRSALFKILERTAGEPIHEIRQEIHATVLDAATAARLDARPGSPALRIVRRYLGTGHRLMEVSVTTLPADRFVYSLTLQRQSG
jgi:GntR family transcriptional regulator